MPQFSNNPDWHAAAQELINQFAELQNVDDRVTLLEKLCERLDGDLYPAFLQILYVIEQHADASCKQKLVQTVSYGLSTGRLPSGRLPAWGSSRNGSSRNCSGHNGSSQNDSNRFVSSKNTENAYGQSRLLGPLEFLCAWYSQSTHLPVLSAQNFSQLCASMVRLFSTEPEAATLYRNKLQSDVLNPMVGSLSSRTREGVKTLAESWQQALTADEISHAVRLACEVPPTGLNQQLSSADPFKPKPF